MFNLYSGFYTFRICLANEKRKKKANMAPFVIFCLRGDCLLGTKHNEKSCS